ncbi:hematopoietic death receptor isoform X1 [Brachyhypopomus gauderio]|uniref:hematopoietic death receptor isoform X1 n=1 Tax=Brachyhypopomus gauderio TaxID=698409 RepID=UPI0040434DBC
MKHFNSPTVPLIGTLLCVLGVDLTPAPTLGPGPNRNRKLRYVTCREPMEYLHASICCLSCPAGTFVQQHCSTPSSRGSCEQCSNGTYTEHDNGLTMCLPCSKCRPDQDHVERCTRTKDAVCRCKQGLYCLPYQACEVCKTCSRCREDEEVVEACTSSSNTVCRKRVSTSAGLSAVVAVSVVLVAMALVLIVSLLYWRTSTGWRRAVVSWCSGGFLHTCTKGGRDSDETVQNGVNGAVDSRAQAQPFLVQTPADLVGDLALTCGEVMEAAEEEDRGLGESLPNTATSSQSSLPVCLQLRPSQPCPAPPCLGHRAPPPCPAQPLQLLALENEKPRRLIPLNGDESLKRSFDLFDELDIHYHNRFFRYIGLSDNAIRNAEMSSMEDKTYELLKAWLEKEGLKADFNSLIDALLHLDQRLSAENIIARAISNGYFTYEDD